MLRLLISPLILISFSLFAETFIINSEREDGSTIIGYLSAPENVESFPVIVFIEGSTEESVLANHERIAERFCPHNIGLLSLEKRGVSSVEIDKEEFIAHDCLEDRLQDHILLLQALEKNEIPVPVNQCILLGGSEGGKLAPQLATLFPNTVRALVLVASGGGLPFSEDMKYQSEMLIKQMGSVQRLLYSMRKKARPNEIDETYAKTLEAPESLEMLGPKTYKWWASYLRHNPLPYLLDTHVPIYMIHGEEDIMVPVKSADIIKEAFDKANKENLTYARYKDVGHSLVGRDDVYRALIEWVKKQTKNEK